MHSFVLKSGNVKRAYEEMNALVEEHTAKIIQVDSSMDKLSKKYKAPKEEIAEIIGKLEEYDKLDKEIKKRQAKGDNGAYTKDLIDKQDKFIQNLQNQSNLFQEMFSDYSE
jgi:ABC-type enterochelin transport system substrate-binding protein